IPVAGQAVAGALALCRRAGGDELGLAASDSDTMQYLVGVEDEQVRQAIAQQGNRGLERRRALGVRDHADLARQTDTVDGGLVPRAIAPITGIHRSILIDSDATELAWRSGKRLRASEDCPFAAVAIDAPDTVLVRDEEPLLEDRQTARVGEA